MNMDEEAIDRADPSNTNVYLGNIAPETSEEDLTNHFAGVSSARHCAYHDARLSKIPTLPPLPTPIPLLTPTPLPTPIHTYSVWPHCRDQAAQEGRLWICQVCAAWLRGQGHRWEPRQAASWPGEYVVINT